MMDFFLELWLADQDEGGGLEEGGGQVLGYGWGVEGQGSLCCDGGGLLVGHRQGRDPVDHWLRVYWGH